MAGTVSGLAAHGSAGAAVKPGDIPQRTFGKTGEKVTIIGQAGGRFPLISFEEAKAVTLRAYDLGINYFDNAARVLERPLRRGLWSCAAALPQEGVSYHQGHR